ncbi:P-loop containing nucleoside triphosphate hydrolase protein [Scheffersomyces amazonensis]|uniref:P-loop containing nucleoside triphosphate hydrolase protein n=1 Tax=Scheffersomyces amazonensis TaxID=1078765 RepID=UPI00315DBDC3
MNNNLLEPSPSNNSDTTVTYVDYAESTNDNTIYRQQPPRRQKNNIVSSQTNLEKEDISRLESQELQNQKRWFSFLFSRKVDPIPLDSERELYKFDSSNVIYKLFFWWLWPILLRGYKRTLQPNDLWKLTPELKVEYMHEKWSEHLNKILDKSKKKHLKKYHNLDDYKWPVWAVPYALYLTFCWSYTLSTILLALSFVVQALSPLITRRLIDFIEYRYFGLEKSLKKGIAYTISSVVLIYINGLLMNHFFHTAMTCGAQCKAILTKALLLKSFDLSAKSRYLFPIGRVTSLMSTDLARIDLAIGFQPLVICFPIPVIIAIVLLLTNIGISSLAGIGLFVVSLLFCVWLTKKLFMTREKVVKYTDQRISLMREALTNLKVIKFYAWEMAYRMNITKIREKEMKYLFTIKVLRNFITAYAVTLPTLTSMISFVTMWATNSMKSPGQVFSSLSLFGILAQAIMLLPIALATGADALIGFGRCKDYLSAEELNDELNNKLDEPYINNRFFIGPDRSSEGFEFRHSRTMNREDSENSNLSNGNYDDDMYDSEDEDSVIEIKNANFVWESFHDDMNDSLWDLTKEDKKRSQKRRERKIAKKRAQQAAGGYISVHNEKQEDPQENNRYTKESYLQSIESIDSNINEQFPGLMNINLSIKRNEFIIVTGAIGTGKTSLLNAIAGFMKLDNPSNGKVKVYDELIFCSAPWVQNATVRENILFGKRYNHDKYMQVIDACALEDDIALLPAGDNTEIGERGVTLSGGQKARINLARACYTDADVLLFDDVISAVDSRVAQHIVNRLFRGLLRNKTIILATHQLGILEVADRIVFLNGDGTIDVGKVDELMCRNENFQRLIDYTQERESESNNASEYELNVSNNKEGDAIAISTQLSASNKKDLATGRTMTEEERAINAISWDVYKKYVKLGSGIFGWTALPLFIFFLALSTFFQLFTNTWLSFWMEKKFKGKSDNFYVGWYVGFAFLAVIVTAIQFTIMAYINNRAAEVLNVKAVGKVLHAPMSYMDTTPIGRILNRFTKDTDSLDNEIGEQMRLFVFPFAAIIGIIILCICYLPWFAIAVPFLGGAFTFLANFYQGSSRELKRLEAIQRSLVYNNFNETLTGMATIKSFKAEKNFIERNDYYLNRMNEAYYLAIATQRWLCIHLDMIACMFALIIGMLCITEQFDISPSSTGLLLNYVIQIVGLLALTIRSMTQVENEMNSVERLHEYAFNLPQEAAYMKAETSPPPEWPPSGYIEFKDVSLRYRPTLPLVLKDMNLNIYPGEKVGICGRTGAGKSSIMTALYRLTELEKGSISIDGIDIANLGLCDLRSKLSIIPQDPVLFQGTLRKNLDPFESYGDKVLLDALRRSGLLDEQSMEIVRRTKYDPKNEVGYDDLHKFHLDQLVDDDGVNFSLGERQLIALARSLVRNSKILILDEATSSVDFETDSRIQETISKEFRNCTVLCIAHRLKTILHYDRIIVMDKGKIVEKGDPMQLYQSNGTFKQMCDKANIKVDDFV